MDFVVYILESLKNKRYYIGSTDNISRRLTQHNKGLVVATKNIRPLKLKRVIFCKDRKEAWTYEYRLKKYKSRKIVEKIINDGVFPWEYNSRPHSSMDRA